jgi:hypothetical protein
MILIGFENLINAETAGAARMPAVGFTITAGIAGVIVATVETLFKRYW